MTRIPENTIVQGFQLSLDISPHSRQSKILSYYASIDQAVGEGNFQLTATRDFTQLRGEGYSFHDCQIEFEFNSSVENCLDTLTKTFTV